jgi:hypothetical protein
MAPTKAFKTIKFSLHLRKDVKPPNQNGMIYLTDEHHKLSLGLGAQNFGYLDEIRGKIRKLLEKYRKAKR